jgi:hypothetical protein
MESPKPSGLIEALVQGVWTPCQILGRTKGDGMVLVRVTDDSGEHDVWLAADHVRGR